MSDPMTDAELQAIRARLNTSGPIALSHRCEDGLVLLAEVERQKAELDRVNAERLDALDVAVYCGSKQSFHDNHYRALTHPQAQVPLERLVEECLYELHPDNPVLFRRRKEKKA